MSPSRQNNLVSSLPLSRSSYNVTSAFCTEDNMPQCISYINQVHECPAKFLLLPYIIWTCSFNFCKDYSMKWWHKQLFSFTGAWLTGPLLYTHWGQLTRGSYHKHSASSKCHVWDHDDSPTQYVQFRRARERPAEDIHQLGPHSDEQFQTQGMYDRVASRCCFSQHKTATCFNSLYVRTLHTVIWVCKVSIGPLDVRKETNICVSSSLTQQLARLLG